MKALRIAALLAAVVAVSGCEGTLQKYSAPEHQVLRLEAQDLREGGLAFLTPSTVTGQEEDKQTLAYVFANALKRGRKDLRVLGLPDTISAVNRAGLADEYRSMYHDYRDTAVLDGKVMRQIAKVTGVRYLAQLKLANMQQGARGRFSLFGLSLMQTQYANMRVFLQVWDSRDGAIAWEGIDELTFAIDTSRELPISFRAVAEHAADDLVKRLP
ncbi:MAG TPA: hypothetical protein VEB41_12575 [Burkholderiales bacterium]|nr:hypothetical protein [Burkholderiales bacterium]